MELAGLDVESLAHHLKKSPTYTTLAELAKLVGNLSEPGRRYDGAMPETAAHDLKPLGGPTGRRVAEHHDALLEVLRRHGVTNPETFGSAARGDDREDSDVDLLVDFPVGSSIIDIICIKRELEAVLGVSVDLVPRSGLKARVRIKAAKDLLPL